MLALHTPHKQSGALHFSLEFEYIGFKFFSIQTRDWFYDTVTYKHALLVEAPLYLDLVINSHIIERTGFV